MAGSDQAESAGLQRLTEEMITSTSFDDSMVESGKTYHYWVSTVDLFDVESPLSNPVSFTAQLPPLLPPGRVNVRTVSDGVEVMWNKTLQDNASGYHIYRRIAGSENAERIGEAALSDDQYLDQNVRSGELYWYSVSVTGDQRESAPSSEKAVRVN
jgi:fibronectin type 3 domain-containing protein